MPLAVRGRALVAHVILSRGINGSNVYAPICGMQEAHETRFSRGVRLAILQKTENGPSLARLSTFAYSFVACAVTGSPVMIRSRFPYADVPAA